MARRWLRRLRLAAEIATIAIGVGALGLWCSVPETGKLADNNPTSTAFIDLRRAQAEDDGKAFALAWQWKPLGKISRYLRAAVVYAEDANFYTHDGVDWDAIESAVEKDLSHGSLGVGGSTITQQLAKNLYLSPHRSFVRKLREMLIAFSLEDHLTKQRILELYLNVVEWGDGVFGAEAAARKWFGHSAQALSPSEAAKLAIALPNPITRAPDQHSPELTTKAVRIIRLLRMQGLLTAAQERDALDQVGAPGEKVFPDHALPDMAEGATPASPGPVTLPSAASPGSAPPSAGSAPTEPTEPTQAPTPPPVTPPSVAPSPAAVPTTDGSDVTLP